MIPNNKKRFVQFAQMEDIKVVKKPPFSYLWNFREKYDIIKANLIKGDAHG